MTTPRAAVYQALSSDPGIAALAGDRIYEASSLTNVPDAWPFLVVRMHPAYGIQGKLGRRELAQVWFHDTPGDYMRIDQLQLLSRLALERVTSEAIVEISWFEDSVDLVDSDLGTITRNSRYNITSTRRESHAS